MGAGNFLPAEEMGDYEMVYAEPFDDSDDEYRWLVQNIRDSLPGSFFNIDESRVRSTAVARNALLDVCVADNQYSVAVFVVPTQGIMDGYPSELNLAYGHLRKVARRLFDRLKDQGYKLRIRTGPWTSGQYQ